jgi:TonB family protein
MISRRTNVVIASAFSLVCSNTQGETIHGYVVDTGGHRVRRARVQAWHMVPTDQRPPQQPTRLAETTTNDHGDFAIAVDARQANMLIASYDHNAGATKPSFTDAVRITLRNSAEGIFLYAPRPDLTTLKQHPGHKGSGMFTLHIDTRSGAVTSVDVQKSTGSAFLDQLSAETFRKWRGIPGATAAKVSVPIVY